MVKSKFFVLMLLVVFAANIAFAGNTISERAAEKQAILAQELAMNSLEDPLPGTDDIQEYCSSCYTNIDDDYITNVTFNTINNNSGGEGAPCSYGDYTTLSTDVTVAQTYTLTVTFFSEGTWTEVVRAWVDWNQDEVFDADESYYLGEGVDATVTVDITVPVDAMAGATRMRIIEQYSTDPGADGACDGQGNHTATYGETEDYTVNVLGGSNDGYVTGTVTDLQSVPIDGALVEVGNESMTVGSDGVYMLAMYPMTYSGTASAQYHNSVTIDNIIVAENETTVVDFALPTPMINVDTSPISLNVAPGETITVQRNVSNVGDGELEFNITVNTSPGVLSVRPDDGIRSFGERILRSREQLMSTENEYSPTYTIGNLPTILDFGDEVFMFDPEGQTGDNRLLGIEFDGTYFWVTGATSPPPMHLYKFDVGGNLIATYEQPNNSSWGWRDLAWDGQYLYASDSPEVDIIDPATGQMIGSFNGPENPNRALAYDPATDHFWTGNFGGNFYEFDRNGNVINNFPNTLGLSTYGMAWDDVSDGGPYLWVFSQDGTPGLTFTQINPTNGQPTGVSFMGIDNGSGGIAGGCTFTTDFPTNPAVSVMFGLAQGTPDIVKGYEIAPFSQWLSVDPMSGILQPAGSVDLGITIDFTGDVVPDSLYEATITVDNNTPDTPVINVDVLASPTGIDETSGLPRVYSLAQNFPNPFNAQTKINFAIPQQSDVTLEIYNVLGQKTATLIEGLLPAGAHNVNWDASNVASGVYYYKLSAGDYTSVKMMTLLK